MEIRILSEFQRVWFLAQQAKTLLLALLMAATPLKRRAEAAEGSQSVNRKGLPRGVGAAAMSGGVPANSR